VKIVARQFSLYIHASLDKERNRKVNQYFFSLIGAGWSGQHKYPFKLNFDKFEDDYPEIKNQKFYGFKKIICNNNRYDASFIRDVVCSDIFRAGGVPTARGSFCRMYIDTGSGPVYWGLYTIFEDPADEMLQTQFQNAKGNLYKPEGKGADWRTFNREAFEKKTNEDDADWSDVQAAVTALNAGRSDAAAWRAGLEAVFNVRFFLRWLAINTVIVNYLLDHVGARQIAVQEYLQSVQ
jgi:spore coat protein CotH